MTADNPAALGITPAEWEAIKQMPVMDAIEVIAARTLVAETEGYLRDVAEATS
jgi:hypothetical protein